MESFPSSRELKEGWAEFGRALQPRGGPLGGIAGALGGLGGAMSYPAWQPTRTTDTVAPTAIRRYIAQVKASTRPRATQEPRWQFKNGKTAKIAPWYDPEGLPEHYTAWDRSLGCEVLYAR